MKNPLRRREDDFYTEYTAHEASVYVGQRHVCSTATHHQAQMIARALNKVYPKGNK